jgi:hypothetical protein
MYYDYDDYFNEPNEFEIQVEEFKDSLRNAVKDEIKDRIAFLEKELEDTKEFRDEKYKFIQEYENKIREMRDEVKAIKRAAKESEEKWKKARLHQLLGDYLVVGWKVGYKWEHGEKCDKCDENRRIHFVSPQGKEYEEDCKCAVRYYRYFPQEATLSKIYVRKKNFRLDDKGETDFYNRYYTVERRDDDDYDRYESASDVYEHDDIDFEKVNGYRAVFLNEEDCQKYCDWKTAQALKKMNT